MPKALGDFLVLRAIKETRGSAIAVTDDDAMWGMDVLARLEGAFVCPEGSALVAAARDLRKSGFLGETDSVVLLNTGAGIKCHPTGVAQHVRMLPIGGDIPPCTKASPCPAPCSCGLST